MILDSCDIPIVLAPLAGGPSTPELAAEVSNAGGLGFLASGYLSAAELAGRRRRVDGLTGRPFGVNLFAPGPAGDTARVRQFAAEIEADVSSRSFLAISILMCWWLRGYRSRPAATQRVILI